MRVRLPRRRILGLLIGALVLSAPKRAATATCTGANPCNACKNCSSCKRCAKDGGTCGVCKRAMTESHSQGSGRRGN